MSQSDQLTRLREWARGLLRSTEGKDAQFGRHVLRFMDRVARCPYGDCPDCTLTKKDLAKLASEVLK